MALVDVRYYKVMIIKLNRASTLEQVEKSETEIRINLIQIEKIEKMNTELYGPTTVVETVNGSYYYVTQTPEEIDELIDQM